MCKDIFPLNNNYRNATMQLNKAILGLAVASLMAFTGSALAQTLNIDNQSSSDLTAIYISDSGSDDWEENLLPEGYVLPAGNNVDVNIQGSYNSFDLRIEAESGSEDYMGFPGGASSIVLYGGGQSEYE